MIEVSVGGRGGAWSRRPELGPPMGVAVQSDRRGHHSSY